MTTSGYDGAVQLASAAERLNAAYRNLPTLFALTDPDRTPDPLALARRLPTGSGLVLRTFGNPQLIAIAQNLVYLCKARDIICLIAADPELAQRTGADGVHWPERLLNGTNIRRSRGIITASAHSPCALRKASGLADAVFVSTVFKSNSPSAGRPIGVFRLQAYAQRRIAPIYALGGVTPKTIKRLKNLNICGVGAVDSV